MSGTLRIKPKEVNSRLVVVSKIDWRIGFKKCWRGVGGYSRCSSKMREDSIASMISIQILSKERRKLSRSSIARNWRICYLTLPKMLLKK
jgi:hypothetical protein